MQERVRKPPAAQVRKMEESRAGTMDVHLGLMAAECGCYNSSVLFVRLAALMISPIQGGDFIHIYIRLSCCKMKGVEAGGLARCMLCRRLQSALIWHQLIACAVVGLAQSVCQND